MIQGYIGHYQSFNPNLKYFLKGNFLQALGLSIYNLLFNLYLKEKGFSEGAIGHLISTSTLGIAFVAFPASFILDKFHVKNFLIFGMGLSIIFYLAQMNTSTSEGIFQMGLMGGMCLALFNISVAPFIHRNSTSLSRVHLFSLNASVVMLAHMIGYLLGGFIPETIKIIFSVTNQVETLRYSLLVSMIPLMLSTFLFMKLVKMPIPKNNKRILHDLKTKDWKMIGKLLAPKLFYAVGGGMIVPFINLYLKDSFNFSHQMIGVSYAILQLFIFVGILITPLLIKKMSLFKFILISALLSIPFMLTMALSTSVGIVLGAFFMRGMLMNMSSPMTTMFEMEHMKDSECMFASAIIMFGYNFTYSMMTRFGGLLIEKNGFHITFYAAATCYLGAVICYYFFFKNDKPNLITNPVSTEQQEKIAA